MKRLLLAIAALSLATHSTVLAGGIELIGNGNFETGNLNGWTISSTAVGNVTDSCQLAFGALAVAGGCVAGVDPISGIYGAYTSSSFPSINNSSGSWTNTLSQNFIVPAVTVTNALLSFTYTVTAKGQDDFRGSSVQVSLLSGSTVLAAQTMFQNPATNFSVPWTAASADLTSVLASHVGEALTLQISSTVFYRTNTTPSSRATAVLAGFDDVSLRLTAAPEPPTVMLMGSVLVLGWFYRNRRTGAARLQAESAGA